MHEVRGTTEAGHAERLFRCELKDDGSLYLAISGADGSYRSEMRVNPQELAVAIAAACVQSTPVIVK